MNNKILMSKYLEKMIHKYMILENQFLDTQTASLSTSEKRVLVFIGKNEKCIIREVCDYLMIPKNNMTAILDKLENKGYIRRERSEGDRRVIYLVLTERGRNICNEEEKFVVSLCESLLEPLNEEEQSKFLETMDKIIG